LLIFATPKLVVLHVIAEHRGTQAFTPALTTSPFPSELCVLKKIDGKHRNTSPSASAENKTDAFDVNL